MLLQARPADAGGMPFSFRPALLSAAMTAVVFALPSLASAQPFPDETITGTIQAWTSDETLKIADDRGFVDTVSLSEQTDVAAGREALVVGARVSIRGYNGGNWFDAERIELAAAAAPAAPAYVPPLPAPEPMPQTLPQTSYAPAIPSYSFVGPAPIAVYYSVPRPTYSFSVGVVGGGYRGGQGYARAGGSVQVLELQGNGGGYGRRFGNGQLRARFQAMRAARGGARFRR
jgi:hypothetical protein